MKRIYSLLLICCTLFFVACQQEEKLSEATGYLRLSVNQDRTTNSRAVPADYEPEQIAVQIMDATGAVVQETEDSELWKNQSIELPVGTYTIKASSNGFDGLASGFDIPYYVGSKKVTISSGVELNETITCALANVKVSVSIDANLVSQVKSIEVVVRDTTNVYGQVNFSSTESRSAYFPVTGLKADVAVVNKAGKSNTLTQVLGNGNPVKARDHYMLNIKLQESGNSNITVTVNPNTHEYSYTFNVSTKPTENATLTAGAWDRLAYLKAANVTVGSGVSMDGIKFQYRTAASGEDGAWTDLTATADENDYTAFATGLTASTAYQYRLVNGEGTQIGSIETFTTDATDAQTPLYNGNFDLWSQSGNTIYPDSQENAGNTTSFWNTSNPGTSQGAAAILGALNATTGVTNPVHTAGGHAAKLESDVKMGIFAAASVYTGSFLKLDISTTSADMEFGKPFTSRPIALRGYYQYTPVVMNKVDRSPEGVTLVEGQTMDECSIFIALATQTFTFNNNDESSYIDYEGDNGIIAYGELPSGAATTGSEYTEFAIPLKYKENLFGVQPTHIIIVCSASKYGDYMSGGVGSTLYLDDFTLDYTGTPTIWK